MGKKRKALTQEEIWDDSALLRSWDEALEEYKLYHSIHARGERVEDVLREAETAEQPVADDPLSTLNENLSPAKKSLDDEAFAGGELEGVRASKSNKQQPELGEETVRPNRSPIPTEPHETQASGTLQDASAIPQGTISASTQDEALKSLMMSWYWAGYYTGFYEGQKQPGGPDQ
ncbi:hypothetical protein MMC13_001725 [Lambiella insularis]|nr:hypothetical protein [Lambiella insularis]